MITIIVVSNYFFLFLVFIPIVVIALEILIWFLIVQKYFLRNFECSNKYIHFNHISVCYKYLFFFYLFGELCHKHWDIFPGKVTAQNGYLQSIKMFFESEPFAVNLSSLKPIHSSNIGDVWIRIVAVKGKKRVSWSYSKIKAPLTGRYSFWSFMIQQWNVGLPISSSAFLLRSIKITKNFHPLKLT